MNVLVGERLLYLQEQGNIHDLYAVVVAKDNGMIVSRNISLLFVERWQNSV